jgi:hypothetical protein
MLCILCFANSAMAEEDVCKIPSESRELISMYSPEIGAKLEAKNTTPKFLAVADYSIDAPGVPLGATCNLDSHFVYVVPGTSDTPCSETLEIFQIAARLYATQFNAQLLQLRPDLIKRNCSARSRAQNKNG